MRCRVECVIPSLRNQLAKYVERSWRELKKFFAKEKTDSKCHRTECAVCTNSDSKKPSLCQVKGVVYAGVCSLCEKEYSEGATTDHRGIYIGETARTLSERAGEHRAGYRRMDFKNFMFKHWSNTHYDSDTPPEFRFMVLKKHPEPMSRLIHESIKISDVATLNSKSEWGGIKSHVYL